MDAKVTWNGRMSFTGTADTGFDVHLDAHPSVGGDNNGLRPMELIAIGLVGCTAMDVISIMTKKRQDVTRFEVRTHLETADTFPKVFTKAVIEYVFYGRNLDPKAAQRAIDLSEQIYCPAQAMLKQVMPIELTYTIIEEEA
ncbi:MAG: OsmC family protein [Anaerolineales bacterium]|nr:OsmC family protein [Anaerolineales bacterium]